MERGIYPESVEKSLDFHENIIIGYGFCQKSGVNDEEVVKDSIYRVLGPYMMDKWLNGNELTISPNDINDVMMQIRTDAFIGTLTVKGLIVTNEDGESWGDSKATLTEKGKELLKAENEEALNNLSKGEIIILKAFDV